MSFNLPSDAKQIFPEDQSRTSREIYFYSTLGKKIYPLDPYYCIADIQLWDIATSLSLSYKFCGMTRRPYTMAEHSICLAALIRRNCPDPEQARLALLSASDVMGFGQRSILHFNTPAELALERMTWIEAVWGKFASPILADTDLLQQAKSVILMAERLELLQIEDPEDNFYPDPANEQLNKQVATVRIMMEEGRSQNFWRQRFLSLYADLTSEIENAHKK